MSRNQQLIFDVGLHKGEDTEFYLKKGYRVVAFEANPSLVNECRERFAEEIRSGQLHIVAGAIAKPTANGKVTFYVNEGLSIWGTTEIDWVRRNESYGAPTHAVEVERIDINRAFHDFGVPFYLKIDIEGADGLVLDALRSLSERPQFVSIEANSVTHQLFAQDLHTLSELGYRRFQLVPQQRIEGSILHTDTTQGVGMEHVFPQHSSGAFGADLNGTWVDRDAAHSSFTDGSIAWQDIHASLHSDALTNIAVHRPASQSSTSYWSTDPDPHKDARVANDGDTLCERFFHTDYEWNPWWQVDLGDLYVVEKIVLHNRTENDERLSRLSVLKSLDGRDWIKIFTKADAQRFTILTARIFESGPARYIRVRLDGCNYLHFRECLIFGRPPSATAVQVTDASQRFRRFSPAKSAARLYASRPRSLLQRAFS